MVDHGGDNFLGGKDFDNALTDWAAARLAAETGLPPLSRSNPAHRRPLGKLKAACEQAKIDLSRMDRTSIVCAELALDPATDPVDADLPVSREELERLVGAPARAQPRRLPGGAGAEPGRRTTWGGWSSWAARP